MYNELRTVSGKVDQLGNKIDAVTIAHEDIRSDHLDHETRIRALERNRWPLPSLAALIALASLILAVITFARGG
ncbi:hypothetical protein Skr01_36170 [Sphaerisporangium krabiense]|nr:hypothetical protein Skr01_36170 [Sphaerisporangium krabiense]